MLAAAASVGVVVAMLGVLLERLLAARTSRVAVCHTHAPHVRGMKGFAAWAKGLSYVPSWFLKGRIAQTVWSEVPPVPAAAAEGALASLLALPGLRTLPWFHGYNEEVVPLPEVVFPNGTAPMKCCPAVIPEGEIRLMWYATANTGPVVLVCPGLTSSGNTGYVRQICAALAASPGRYRPVVYQPRGIAAEVKTPFLYSCGYTHDVRRAIELIRGRLGPAERLFALGLSMGGNYIVKYVGEEGEKCAIDAVCSLAGPVDCASLMETFEGTAYGRWFFNPLLTSNLQKLRKRAEPAFADHPTVDLEQLRSARTVREFDEYVTCKTMGCRDADHYYDVGSSMHSIATIRRPAMFLHAENDPIVPAGHLPYDRIAANPYIISLTTRHGAHSMIWPHGPCGTPWAVTVVDEFFRTVGKH